MNGSGQRSVAVIPARGGSKRIPRKNIRPLAGIPLVTRAIQTVVASKAFEVVVVSTDDAEIAEVSRSAGAEVRDLRPAHLATDAALSIDVVLHELEQFADFSHGALVQATSPLMTCDDICSVMSALRAPGVTSAVSVVEIHQATQTLFARNHKSSRLDQVAARSEIAEAEEIVQLNGAIYAFEIPWLRQTRRFIGDGTVGCVMPRTRSIDVDEEIDWQFAEFLIRMDGGN